MTLSLKYYKMFGDVRDLEFATPGSACFDVRAYFGHSKSHIVTVYTKDNAEVNYMATKRTHTDTHNQLVLSPGDRALVPTGIILDIPEGYSVRGHPRSGLSLKQGLTLANCEAVIDWDYTKQLYILVMNTSSVPVTISHEDRIAQLEMSKVLCYNIEARDSAPDVKTSRVGGLGSTGVK